MTNEQREKVIELLIEKWTSNEIAKEVGVSRNAVCGLRHRYNIKREAADKIGNFGQVRRTKPKKIKEPKQWQPRVVQTTVFKDPPVVTIGKKIHRLKDGECKYAVTSHNSPPADHRFCGKPQRGGSPYCDEHHKLCRETVNDRKKPQGTAARGPLRLADRFHYSY